MNTGSVYIIPAGVVHSHTNRGFDIDDESNGLPLGLRTVGSLLLLAAPTAESERADHPCRTESD
jgi:hypothetical protein